MGRFALAFLLMAVCGVAYPQGLSNYLPWQEQGKELANFPLSTSGAVISDSAIGDPGLVVSHVTFSATTIQDSTGKAWQLNGPVPYTSASPFTTARNGVGPFADGKMFYADSGIGAPGVVCAVLYVTDVTTSQIVLDNRNGSTGFGWYINIASGKVSFSHDAVATPKADIFIGVNVVCGGSDGGSTRYVKVNGGTSVTDTTGTYTNGNTRVRMGLYINTGLPFLGTIYEVFATNSLWDEAKVTLLQQTVLGHYSPGQYSPITVVRDSAATYENPAGTLWTVPKNVARITSSGVLTEQQRSNYVLQSSMSSGTSAVSPWVLGSGPSLTTVTTVAGAPGGGTWAEVTGVTNIGYIYQPTITTPAATTVTGSVWMAKAPGFTETYAGLLVGATSFGASTCSCIRSDNQACSGAIVVAGDYCLVEISNLGTTPIRLSVTVTGSSKTTFLLQFRPGRDSVAVGTTRFAAPQLEIGPYPTSFIGPVTSVAVTRYADQISATVPSVVKDWCITGTFKPEEGLGWATQGDRHLWALQGTLGTTNAAFGLALSTGGLKLWIYDSAVHEKGFATANLSLSAGTAYRQQYCGSANTVWLNGLRQATTASGVGTGILSSVPTTLYFGNTKGADFTYSFGGFIKDVKFCQAKSASKCK